MQVNSVRASVQAGLTELGLENAALCGERFLIRNGSWVGIVFAFEEVEAVCYFNRNHVEFVSNSGKVLKILAIERDQDVAVKAA